MVDLYYMLPSGASYKSEACVKDFEQRVLNDFIEDLSHRHMIWLLPPLPLVSSTGYTQEERERETTF
jgi:hypothetical protein